MWDFAEISPTAVAAGGQSMRQAFVIIDLKRLGFEPSPFWALKFIA